MFMGIHAEEPEGLAFVPDEANTWMPMIDMCIRRQGMFSILSKTVGSPRVYSRRTCSGCSTCMHQRHSELVGLL